MQNYVYSNSHVPATAQSVDITHSHRCSYYDKGNKSGVTCHVLINLVYIDEREGTDNERIFLCLFLTMYLKYVL